MMTRKKRENIVSVGVALGSAAVLIWVIPTFTPPYPGYGVSSALLPNLAFGIILALALLMLGIHALAHLKARAIPQSGAADESPAIPPDDRVHLLHLAAFMIPCILLMPVMQYLGFIPGGLLFMLLIQFLCGQRRPVTMAIVAVGTVGAIYAAMRYGLNVPMP